MTDSLVTEEHIDIARKIASYWHRRNEWIEEDDFLGACLWGLAKANDNWLNGKGTSEFTPYAYKSMQWYCKGLVRDTATRIRGRARGNRWHETAPANELPPPIPISALVVDTISDPVDIAGWADARIALRAVFTALRHESPALREAVTGSASLRDVASRYGVSKTTLIGHRKAFLDQFPDIREGLRAVG